MNAAKWCAAVGTSELFCRQQAEEKEAWENVPYFLQFYKLAWT